MLQQLLQRLLQVPVNKMYSRLHQRSAITRFLHELEHHCEYSLDVVVPKRIGGGQESECFANALDASRTQNLQLCSGWLVQPMQRGGFQFIAHWWNYAAHLGHYVDYSPAIDEFAVYVLDMDLASFSVNNNHRLRSCVCSSLVLRANQWLKVSGFGAQVTLHPIKDLSTQSFFSDYLESTSY